MNAVEHDYIRIVCCSCGRTFDCPLPCGNRFCDVCTVSRRNRVRRRLSYLVDHVPPIAQKQFLHLTLTIANQADLSNMIKQLTGSFRRLRQRALWKNHVAGGAFVLEVTKTDAGWHAHIHAIIQSSFIKWKLLVADWKAVSGGQGVYIKKIPKTDIIRYLTKYLTKTSLSIPDQFDASGALKGSRLFQPFGSWYAISCDAPRYKPHCTHCQATDFMPIDHLISTLRKGTPVTAADYVPGSRDT